MAANKFEPDRTTPAVRLTRPLTDWTPRPRRYGTPPKIRPLALRRMISRKRRCLTGPVWRRESDGQETTRRDCRNHHRAASGRPRLVGAFAVGGQPLPCRPHFWWRLVRVLSHPMEPAGQYCDYRI